MGLLTPRYFAGVSNSVLQDDWGNAKDDYNASGVSTTTTTNGSISSGSLDIPVADASTFQAGHGISIVGAGTAGADHLSSVVSVNVNTITIAAATVTTISTGAIVYHDDTAAIQAGLSDSTKGVLYLPEGDYIISTSSYISDAILVMNKMGKSLIGAKFLGGRLYNNQAAYGNLHDSTIYFRNATADGIHMGSSGTNIVGINLVPHSTITPTAGSVITIGVQTDAGTVYESSSANYTRDHNVSNVDILGGWIGITAWQEFQLHIDRTNVIGTKKYGLLIDRKVPYGGDDFTNMAFALITGGTGTGAGSAIFVNSSDWNRFESIHSNNNLYAFYHNLSTTSQGQQVVNGLIVDEIAASGYGIYISGSTVQSAGDVFSGASRMYLSTGTGFYYLGTNSRRNIITNFVFLGTPTNTDNGTGNLISGNTS